MADTDLIATIPRNSREEIRVTIGEFKGRSIFGLRVWYSAGDGTMRPGKDGLAVRAELLPEIAEALRLALVAARERGMVP